MWSGKMATRWRRKDGHLTPGKGHFLPDNNLNEFITDIEMDTHSSVDHSILAIFEDTSASENRAAAEEDREKLLSALTEMLESVEDDDDTLSPFSSLPQTSLLMSQDKTKCAISLSDVLGVEEKSESEETKETVNKLQNGAFFQPSNNKVDTEVEVFTSLSLVNLVKIMHPYCLKLQVEDELEKSSENSVLFSKEEVWKYQRPTEDTDEEINVVSEDEESKEETENTLEFSSKPLKSALLNASPIKKEKKRVSFGPVQVTSFDLDSQTSDIISPATTHPSPKPIDDKAVLEAAISSENDQMPDSQKSEGKRKLLSLQQYRQLREKRLPLVEKQGNYTTKWPSVPVPPKELTPILGVNGQKHCKQTAAQNATGNLNKKVHAASELTQKAKRPRPNAKTQPNLPVTVCNRSPTKKQTIVSSDPPNPVLVPLSAQHPQENGPALHQNNSTLNCLQATEEKDLKNSSTVSTCNNHSIIQAEVKTCLPKNLDLTSHCSAHSPPLPYEPPTPVTTPVTTPVKEIPPEVTFGISLPSQHLPLCTSSGIEASDLTSLLEQFEETQAKEEGGSESAAQVNTRHLSKLDRSASNAVLLTNPVSTPNTALHMSPTKEHSSTSPAQNRFKIPEPFGTEVILSTREQPVKRKGPPVKAIQIIDPRPMPFKRTHTTQVESTFIFPHVYSAILSDHDYCSVSVGNGQSKLNQTESIDINEANTKAPDSCPKQTSEVVALITSAETNAPKEGPTKALAPQPTLLTGGAKKLNCDIRMESCMVPPTPPPSPPSRDPDGTSLEPRDQDRTTLEPTDRDGTSPEHGDRDRTSPVPRGRSRKSYRRRSRSSSSSSSSSSCSSAGSPSPNRKRHYWSSESSSCSSSSSRSASRSPPRRRRHFSRTRFSRSRSSSWSEPRSRSRSYSPQPRVKRRRLEDVCSSSRQSRKLIREEEIRTQKLRAIDERRVVYVGRIRRTMTHEELRDRFVQFGDVESVSLHFRDRGDHYGFVTFYNMEDAFAAIDNGDKLRRPDELPFDICFGGRRQFCNSNYADLDANRDVDSSPVQSRFEEVDFDLLLKQAQKGLKR
ncbi:unnamed protein product [Knipowitschia caucasica]